MSSVTSTKGAARTHYAPGIPDTPEADQGMRPWQFFVLAALACATGVTWMARQQGFMSVLLLTIIMGTIAVAAMAMLRTIRPLVTAEEDRTQMVGERTRVALEREKMLTLRAIKELEFDRAMKKLSDDDFQEMSGRLRTRASRLIRQLDAGGGYRDRIEKDLVKRLGEHGEPAAPGMSPAMPRASAAAAKRAAQVPCTACSTLNDPDARFCKGCGAPTAAAPTVCAACSTTNDHDAKFCKSCGAKL